MTECCCPALSTEDNTSHWQSVCPDDGTKGNPVKLISLKSLLTPTALEQLEAASAYRFCSSPNCPVVYFSEQGQTFTTADLKVPIFQKDVDKDVSVCYCFGWSRQRIREEVKQSGKNSVIDIITAHIKAKRCGCEVNNPQGSCCLSNVRLTIEQAIEELA
jgi:hypothetical protein